MDTNAFRLRPGGAADLTAIASIQAASPASAQWDVREYLEYDFWVAECLGAVAGFMVSRTVAEGESELLNLAVDPGFRRRGIARQLLLNLISRHPGAIWLEVRESNAEARKLYENIGFTVSSTRPGYYPDWCESAIVMNFHS